MGNNVKSIWERLHKHSLGCSSYRRKPVDLISRDASFPEGSYGTRFPCWPGNCVGAYPVYQEPHGTPCWVSAKNYLLTEKAKVTLAPNKTLQYDQYFGDRATYEVKGIFFRWLCPNENGNRAITKHLELGCSLTYCQMVQPTVQHRVCHIPRNGSWLLSKRSMLEVYQ